MQMQNWPKGWFSPGTHTAMRKCFRVVRVTAVQDKSTQLEHRALPLVFPITVTFSSLILTPDLWQTPPETPLKPWNSKSQVAAFYLENSGASANYFPHGPKRKSETQLLKTGLYSNHRYMGVSWRYYGCVTMSFLTQIYNCYTSQWITRQNLKVQ